MITAEVVVTPKQGILDPQGRVLHHALESLGFGHIAEVRTGKIIRLTFDGISREEAERCTVAACQKLLANPVVEDFAYQMVEGRWPGQDGA